MQHQPECQYASAGILACELPVAIQALPQPSGHKGVKRARFDLLPPDALWTVAELYGKGAEKYAERNWERGYEWSKSCGAIGRHWAAILAGEFVDPETGLPHAASICFHALALIAFEKRGVGVNDLPQLDTHLDSDLLNPEDLAAARAEVG